MMYTGLTNIGTLQLPECFHPSKVPQALLAAENGKFEWLPPGENIELSGGSAGILYRWSESSVYGAVVDLTGEYPVEGKLARNANRTEKITLVSGEATLHVNGARKALLPGCYFVVSNGDTYSLKGKGKLVVTVKDLVGGATLLIDETQGARKSQKHPTTFPASFSTHDLALEFARRIISDNSMENARPHVLPRAGEYLSQIYVKRELVKTQGLTEIAGTILFESETHRPHGLSFIAYTDECDSGHDYEWIEDFKGNEICGALIPR